MGDCAVEVPVFLPLNDGQTEETARYKAAGASGKAEVPTFAIHSHKISQQDLCVNWRSLQECEPEDRQQNLMLTGGIASS